MINWLQIGLGAGLLWYTVLRGAKALKAGLNGFSFRNVDVVSGVVSLDLNLLVKNPLLVGVTIHSVSGDVFAQGVQVGAIDTTFNYYLAGGKTHILPVTVNLKMADVGQAAIRNIQSGDISTLTIQFDGKIYVGTKKNVTIPLRFNLDYNDLVK